MEAIATNNDGPIGVLCSRLAPRATPYIKMDPNAKQAFFMGPLFTHRLEVLFGGSAGGSKSWALLGAALQFADTPGYSALLLRRTYKDLSLPGALMDIAHQWLGPTDAVWNGQDKTWRFPSGATLTFGYLDHENDVYQYQGAQFQFIGFDELTQFTEKQYKYLFSRLRKPEHLDVPLRMRSASNPGGIGHEWVYGRFPVDGPRESGAYFVPSSLDDNPYLDADEYKKSLSHLDPVTRAQLLHGDWSVRPPGAFFQRQWFNIVDLAPRTWARRVRYWDVAASTSETAAHTAGVRISRVGDRAVVDSVIRGKWTSGDRDDTIVRTAAMDGHDTAIYVEQEPGSGGKAQVDYLIKRLAGYEVYADKVTDSKGVRAAPFASYAEAGNVDIVRAPWNAAFLDELEAFDPASANFRKLAKDQVDAAAGAFEKVTGSGVGAVWIT